MARLDELRTRLAAYQTAELAILDGAQEYAIGSRSLKRADLSKISDMIKYLEKEIATEESKANGGGRNWSGGIVPRDI